MKKPMLLFFVLVLALCLTGCKETVVIEDVVVGGDLIPQIMVDGVIYADTSLESAVTDRKDGFDGEITSKVDQSKQPSENGQSNFGVGYGYQYGEKEGTVDLYINGRWWIFATEEAKDAMFNPEPITNAEPSNWGLALETENVTAKGLTILCRHGGGENVFQLQTGSYYVIQKSEEAGWVDVEFLPQEYDVAWTAEAWMIARENTTSWDVDWEWLYGPLPPGDYRIGKEIMNFKGPGDYEKGMLYADFIIE